MLLYSYFACSFTSPGFVPPHWSPFPDPEVPPVQLAQGQHIISLQARCMSHGTCTMLGLIDNQLRPATLLAVPIQLAPAEQRRAAFGIARQGDRSDPRCPRFCKKCQVSAEAGRKVFAEHFRAPATGMPSGRFPLVLTGLEASAGTPLLDGGALHPEDGPPLFMCACFVAFTLRHPINCAT